MTINTYIEALNRDNIELNKAIAASDKEIDMKLIQLKRNRLALLGLNKVADSLEAITAFIEQTIDKDIESGLGGLESAINKVLKDRYLLTFTYCGGGCLVEEIELVWVNTTTGQASPHKEEVSNSFTLDEEELIAVRYKDIDSSLTWLDFCGGMTKDKSKEV